MDKYQIKDQPITKKDQLINTVRRFYTYEKI